MESARPWSRRHLSGVKANRLTGEIIVQSAAGLVQISWKHKNMESGLMPSLTADFDELMQRVEAGREFSHASFEPIYYLVFHPREILEVKRQRTAWTARLKTQAGMFRYSPWQNT